MQKFQAKGGVLTSDIQLVKEESKSLITMSKTGGATQLTINSATDSISFKEGLVPSFLFINTENVQWRLRHVNSV